MENKLIELFELLCDDFKKLLSSGEMNSTDRKILMEFLKDNQVSVVGMKNKNIKSIVESLPFSEDVEQGRAINQ